MSITFHVRHSVPLCPRRQPVVAGMLSAFTMLLMAQQQRREQRAQRKRSGACACKEARKECQVRKECETCVRCVQRARRTRARYGGGAEDARIRRRGRVARVIPKKSAVRASHAVLLRPRLNENVDVDHGAQKICSMNRPQLCALPSTSVVVLNAVCCCLMLTTLLEAPAATAALLLLPCPR